MNAALAQICVRRPMIIGNYRTIRAGVIERVNGKGPRVAGTIAHVKPASGRGWGLDISAGFRKLLVEGEGAHRVAMPLKVAVWLQPTGPKGKAGVSR